MDKGELPVDEAGEFAMDVLQGVWAGWRDVDSDSEGEGEDVVEVDVEVEGGESVREKGLPGYSASLRHYQVAEGRVRAWQQRRELIARMKVAAEREKRARVAAGSSGAEDGDVDDDEMDGVRDKETREMNEEALARARAGKKRVRRGRRFGLMVNDAASRIHGL